jgi:replicative DNA helicase
MKVIPFEERRRNLKDYIGEDEVKTAFEVYSEIKEKSKSPVFYRSKIPTLDKLTGGFAPGELITISGPTKNGKTLLAQTITKNFYLQQAISLWFSFEVPPLQFIEQFGSSFPLIYMPRLLKPNNLFWLEDRIIEAIEKFTIQAVFIDHLHFLFDMMATRNPSLQIGQVVRTLKQIAINHNLVVFLMAHTNKAMGSGDEMAHFQIRDSSFISQESDCVLMIKRHLKNKNEGIVKVEFHRRTGVLSEIVHVIKEGLFLQERADPQYYKSLAAGIGEEVPF